MTERIQIDPRKQFSKKLAKWTAAFWFAFMAWLSVILVIRPEAALFSVYMGIIATMVMLINVISYTRNSIAEKMAFTMLDKTKLELTLNGKGEKNEEEEEGENG